MSLFGKEKQGNRTIIFNVHPNDFGTGNHLKGSRTFGLCRTELCCPSCGYALSRGKGWTLHAHLAVQPLESHPRDVSVHRRELWSHPSGQAGPAELLLVLWELPETQRADRALPVPRHVPSS